MNGSWPVLTLADLDAMATKARQERNEYVRRRVAEGVSKVEVAREVGIHRQAVSIIVGTTKRKSRPEARKAREGR